MDFLNVFRVQKLQHILPSFSQHPTVLASLEPNGTLGPRMDQHVLDTQVSSMGNFKSTYYGRLLGCLA